MTGYWIGRSGRMYNIENYMTFSGNNANLCLDWLSVMFIMTLTRILTDAEVLTPKSKWKQLLFIRDSSLAIGIFYAIKLLFLSNRSGKDVFVY